MANAWKWVVGAVVAAGLFVLVCVLRARGKKPEANRAMADVIDAWTEPKLAAQRARVDQLGVQLGQQHAEVKAAAAVVADTRARLEKKYQALELTPEEIAARLKGLRI